MSARRETATIRTERTFPCSPQELWAAWTEPDRLAKWFGPFDVDNVVDEMDVRPGGRLRSAMVDAAGNRYPIWGTYVTVDPPRELVFTAEAKEIEGHVATVRVRFDEVPGGTRMRFEQSGLPRDLAGDTHMGWTLSWDKLEGLYTADRQVLITRELAAPPDVVFRAWTEPREVDAWWGPDGFRNTTHGMDVRPGGQWRYTMHGPDGTDYENLITYQEVDPPNRLTYLHGSPDQPDQFRGTVTFERTETGGTRLRMRNVFPTRQALEDVKKFGAVELGKQTVERLAAYVAERVPA